VSTLIEKLPSLAGFMPFGDRSTWSLLILRDGFDQLQVVYHRGSNEDIGTLLAGLNEESVVAVRGRVKLDDRVKLDGVELFLDEIEVLSAAEPELPIRSDSALDKRLDWRFIDLRSERNLLIFKVQTAMEASLRKSWLQRGLLEIHSPKLMGAASESGAELFELPYFGVKAYLAQSPQFYKQMAMASGFAGVFEVGPVFRANPSFTSRHDTEFTSIDVEIAWICSHEDVMRLEEEFLWQMLLDIKPQYGDDIERVFGREIVIPETPFPRIPLSEARQLIEEDGYEIPREQGDLDPEGERRLADYVKREFGHEFVFVTDYPASVRPFYHMRYEDRPDTTRSFDLLWRGLEITTGAQREHRFEILRKQAQEKGLSEASLSYYLDFFRYGCPPHGGLGLGLTRLLMITLNVPNVREVTFLYRGPNRLAP
jgi:nondiscriminating aspartyl-tRNA synthetase